MWSRDRSSPPITAHLAAGVARPQDAAHLRDPRHPRHVDVEEVEHVLPVNLHTLWLPSSSSRSYHPSTSPCLPGLQGDFWPPLQHC